MVLGELKIISHNLYLTLGMGFVLTGRRHVHENPLYRKKVGEGELLCAETRQLSCGYCTRGDFQSINTVWARVDEE